MIGLPYPNIKSPELNEKMDYLNSTQVNKLTTKCFCILQSDLNINNNNKKNKYSLKRLI